MRDSVAFLTSLGASARHSILSHERLSLLSFYSVHAYARLQYQWDGQGILGHGKAFVAVYWVPRLLTDGEGVPVLSITAF